MIWSLSRRVMLAAGAITAAAVSLGLTNQNFFSGPKESAISYDEARARLGKYLGLDIKESSKAFGVDYSAREAARIHEEVWDATKLVLNQYYDSSEGKRTKNDDPGVSPPMAAEKMPTTGAAAPASSHGSDNPIRPAR